jgi:beta-phosphoglucomutase-like phosphatase (HAD superfamily)
VDRHPERRVKAAYAAFEARRLPELEAEHAGLRRQQRIELVRKEFARSAENPFNQVVASYDASQDEVRGLKAAEREKIEARLGEA